MSTKRSGKRKRVPTVDELEVAVAKDIAKAGNRLKNNLCNAAARMKLDHRKPLVVARYVLSVTRFDFLNNRNTGKQSADELQAILEKHGVAAWFLKKKPKEHRRLDDEEIVHFLTRVLRHRSHRELDALTAQANVRVFAEEA
jgi:hypothetical protein